MKQENGLLICPTCLKRRITNVMGSIDPQGLIHIARFSKNGKYTTIVQATNMTVLCQCGFGTTLISTNTQVITYKNDVYNSASGIMSK